MAASSEPFLKMPKKEYQYHATPGSAHDAVVVDDDDATGGGGGGSGGGDGGDGTGGTGDAWQPVPHSKRMVCTCVALSTISGLLFGYDTGVVSSALFYMAATQNFGLSTFQKELWVSACVAAAMVGALAVSALSAVFGRKTIVITSAVLFAVGAAVMAACPEGVFWLTVLGRVVVGLGLGLSSTVVPVYISEVAPAHLRGTLTALNIAAVTGGHMTSALLAFGLSYLDPRQSWRYMLGLSAVPAAVQCVGFFAVPESPRWLLLRHRHDRGRAAALEALRRIKHDGAMDAELEVELDHIASSLPEKHHPQQPAANAPEHNGDGVGGRCARLCASRRLVKLLFVGCLLQFTQQIAGINTILYYGSQIVETALLNISEAAGAGGGAGNVSTAVPETDLSNGHTVVLITAGLGFVNFVSTMVGVFLADRCTRRGQTLWSLLLSVILLDTAAAGFYFEQTYFALASCAAYLAAFECGMGPMPWTINSEIYPLSIRGMAVGVSTLVNWASTLLISQSFLSVAEAFSGLFVDDTPGAAGNKGLAFTMWSLGIASSCTLVVLFYILPETGKMRLERAGGTAAPPRRTHGSSRRRPLPTTRLQTAEFVEVQAPP